MPTLEALHTSFQAVLGVREPEAFQLQKLGSEHPLTRQLRDARTAAAGIPPRLGRFRRDRLIAWDRSSTTWEAWDLEGGQRVLLRAARADAWGRPITGHGLPIRDGWPHRHSPPFLCTLADLLPLEDPPDMLWAVGIVTAVLRDLDAVHQHNRAHGQVGPSHITWDGRWHLLDPGTEEPGSQGDDLVGLGHLMLMVDPNGFMGDLGETFIESPPPCAADAAQLFSRALAGYLTEAHCTLVRRIRGVTRTGVLGRLYDLAHRLRQAVPPPLGAGCLSAGSNGSFVLVVSDGHSVRGGVTAVMDIRTLPMIASADYFDAPANRALLRAWITRRPNQEASRQRIQAGIGSDADIERIMSWLASAARLRAELLLLGARYR